MLPVVAITYPAKSGHDINIWYDGAKNVSPEKIEYVAARTAPEYRATRLI